ncbi:MAG: hypothetical protein WD940_00625 [Patescibacteria group bacterium]
MTKELGVVVALTLVVLTSWVGWLFFERASILTQVDYSEKTSAPLNPILRVDLLQESTGSGD